MSLLFSRGLKDGLRDIKICWVGLGLGLGLGEGEGEGEGEDGDEDWGSGSGSGSGYYAHSSHTRLVYMMLTDFSPMTKNFQGP